MLYHFSPWYDFSYTVTLSQANALMFLLFGSNGKSLPTMISHLRHFKRFLFDSSSYLATLLSSSKNNSSSA